MKRTFLFLAALVSATLSGCAENPATGGNFLTTITPAQERAIGRQSAEAELKRYGQYNPESATSRYVVNLCQRIWSTTEKASEPVSCIFTDSEVFNAWATPGYINVYRGLLPYVQSEAQLAAVLAHESGHVSARHIAQSASKEMILGVLTTVGAIYVGTQTDDATMANLAYTAGAFAGGAALMAYSREHELQADALGQRYMERAGYDRREEVSMLKAMAAYEGYESQVTGLLTDGKSGATDLLGTLFASHPNTPQRRARALQEAGAEPDGSLKLPAGITPATPLTDPQGTKRYHQAINGLPFGPKVAYGVAGRGYLAIPQLQLKLALPDGFILRYAEAEDPKRVGTWLGVHPASGVKLQVRFPEFTDGMNVANAMQEAISGLEVQPVTVGGRQAYAGRTSGGKPVLAVGIPLTGKNALALVVYSFPDAATQTAELPTLLNVTTQSAFLTEAQAKAIQPLKITTHSTTAALPVSLPAEDLPSGALREEWFRALNGLSPDVTSLPPGSWYKTVTDPNRF